MKMIKINKKYKCFTILELIVVIAIIGILSAIIIVVLSSAKQKAVGAVIISNMDQINKVASLYYYDNKLNYPTDTANGIAPAGLVPTYLASWPDKLCDGKVIYDWDSWTSWDPTGQNKAWWTPIVRISLRRITDDTTIYYQGIQSNDKGAFDCNVVDPAIQSYDLRYCKAYAPISEAPPTLTCADLLDTTKYPPFPPPTP